ncbi:unnamed protein product, partial [Symbiodinium sp. CCMP2592]
ADLASPFSEAAFTQVVDETSTASSQAAKPKQKSTKKVVRVKGAAAKADVAADPVKAEQPTGDVAPVAPEVFQSQDEKAKEEDSLVEAAGRGDLDKVKDFLAKRYDPNELESGKGTSSFAPEPSVFRRLAEQQGLLMNAKSPGTRPLIAAAVSGHSHVAWELLRFGADVTATDSDGLPALVAASCSTACDIHMWFLLNHAFDQKRKKPVQRSDTPSDNRPVDEKLTMRMLVTLLRGEGQIFTDMVSGLLKEVEPGQFRSERLKERVRTVLCDYALDRKQVHSFLTDTGRKSIFGDDRNKKPEDVDAFNLSWHNMLYAPEVQVTLRSLPIAAPLACKPSVLAALAETANEETLQTDAVEAITAAAWLQMRVATAVDNFLNCVALGCLCLVTWACRYGGMDAQPALWVLAIIQFKEAVELLSQLGFYCWSRLTRSRKNAQSFWLGRARINGEDMELLGDEHTSWVHPAPSLETLVDLLFLGAGSGAIYRQMDLCVNQELEPIFLPGFCSMYWLRLMYSLRGERWLGPYLLPILSAVRDTGAFFFVTSLCVASATHAYVIMNPRGEDDFPVYSAFTHTVRLAIFGDFDLFEYQGQDTNFEQVEGEWAPKDPSPTDLAQLPYIYLQLCFFCTGIGITVLLMNLLIAILSQNYEMQQDRAQGLFVQARARMLLEVQRRPWMMVGAWLGRKLLDPEALQPQGAPYWHFGKLAEISLSPLTLVMEPLVRQGAYYQKNIFDRFLQRALWSPISKYKVLALGIPVVCLVLLAGSVISLLVFAILTLLLQAVGFRLTGIRYTLNLSLFGLFGDRFAEECEIFALVRTEPVPQ